VLVSPMFHPMCSVSPVVIVAGVTQLSVEA
jgi:hypothetical protein